MERGLLDPRTVKRFGWWCALALAACGGKDAVDPGWGGAPPGGGGAGGSGGGSGGLGPELVWEACAIASGAEGDEAACARPLVPVRWAEPDGSRIELFVKRIGDAAAPRQLWMLNGGPGASGADFEPLAEYFVSLDSGLAVFLPDHRGTGRSTRLGCPDQESPTSPGGLAILADEWPACLAYVEASFGDILDGFRTTEAAGDLGWLIEQTRGPDQHAVVFGGSYGTLWAQRYLALFPEQADAITMLGIAHPSIGFDRYDQSYDAVGMSFLDACSADALCSSKLGPDAAARARDILDQVDSGHCAEAGLDRTALQSLFAYWLLWSWEERALVPAILYRLERCAPGDVTALQYLAGLLAAPVPVSVYDQLHSVVLATHIGLSEMWNDPSIGLSELQDIVEKAVFSLAVGPRLRAHLDDWPTYQPDPLVGQLAPSDRPMLLIEGELDPATPALEAKGVADFYAGPEQHYFLIPGAPHSFHSPTPSGTWCSLAMFFFYVADPSAPIYDCIDDVLPLDFTSTPELAAYLGTGDMWENTSAFAAPPPSPPTLAGYRSALRRGLR